ncbi:hypothetical protein B0F90DRAFT_1796485, partial [Multifurca ochricompacta]
MVASHIHTHAQYLIPTGMYVTDRERKREYVHLFYFIFIFIRVQMGVLFNEVGL